MPFSGPGDPSLPDNIRKLPAKQKRQWISVFNSAFAKCEREGGSDCEASAFRQANGVALALETRDITGVEVLSVGVWNGVPFTKNRLDDIVDASKAIAGQLDAPVKLGHDTDQELVQNDGFPAAGWVENLRRIGNLLLADFEKVPVKIAELIDIGALRKRSSEIQFDFKVGDTTYPAVLTGVALLGEDLPAVESLEDITELYQQFEIELPDKVTLVYSELAVWSAAFINHLSDSSFAGLTPGGRKENGSTVPKSLRHLPHHGEGGDVDLPHLRAALSRVSAVKASVALKRRMLSHLRKHAIKKKMDVKKEAKLALEAFAMEDELRELLGLDESADVTDSIKGLISLKAELGKALDLKEGETLLEKVALLKKGPEKDPDDDDPDDDPALRGGNGAGDKKAVAALSKELSDTQQRVVTLEGKAGRATAESLVEEAIEEGRLIPAQRESSIKLALANADDFRVYLEALPKGIVPKGEIGTAGGDGSGVDLALYEPSDVQVKTAKDLGVWSPAHRITLIRQNAMDKGVELPEEFGKKKGNGDGK